MNDARVLESLLNALDDQETVVDEPLVRAALRIASDHQFDADRSAARVKLVDLVSSFVDKQVEAEADEDQ